MPSPWKMRAGGTRQTVNTGEVRRALEVLCDPRYGVELRGLPSGRSHVRKGDDLDGLLEAVELLADDRNIYLCLNPVPLGVKTARKDNVIERRWFFLDIDPTKPDDQKDNPATDAERASAQSLAGDVFEYLSSLGWPAPVTISSGNGWYLAYRISLPNDTHSQEIIRNLLRFLAEKFSGPRGGIDKSVHDAPRIARLPGTMNRKGAPSDDRPFRQCLLHHVPLERLIVSAEMIVAATGEDQEDPATQDTIVDGPKPFLLLVNESDKAAYGRAALDREAGLLKITSSYRNNALNTAAFRLGQLIPGGYLSRSDVESALNLASIQCGLNDDPNCGPAGIRGTIKSGIEAGMKHPREAAERNGTPADTTRSAAKAVSKEASWLFHMDGEVLADGTPLDVLAQFAEDEDDADKVRHFQMHTLGGLMAIDFPEPKYVVKGILSEGLNILAGAPKQGKSMLALNLAMTIAGGGMALGNTPVECGDVLYLSLEDKARRVKLRALKMLEAIEPHLRASIEKHLTIVTDWPRQDEGGLKLMDLWLRRVRKPVMFIVDVWNKFAPAYKQGNTYNQDAEYLGAVKKYADKRSITAEVIHHTRKPSGGKEEDYVHGVSGTMGLTGAADGIAVLLRARQENQATLSITGRDFAESELVLEFNVPTLTWRSIGTAKEHIDGKVRKAVVAYLSALPAGQTAFATEIAEAIEEKPDSVRRALGRLREEGEVRKVGRAWAYPADEREIP